MAVLVRADCRAAFGSVCGPVRVENQDDFLYYEPADEDAFARHGRLVAIADGMGGEAGGAEASRTVLRALLASYLDDEGEAAARLDRGLIAARTALHREVHENPGLTGMGTTLTAFAVSPEGRVVGRHLGDSRCLLLRAGRAEWITSLHLNPLDEHQLTRAVVCGSQPLEAESFELELAVEDKLLLMSDGVWRALSESEVLATSASCAVDELVEVVLERAQRVDGSDNATIVALSWHGAEAREASAPQEVSESHCEERTGGLESVSVASPLARWWPWLLVGLGVGLGAAAWALR